jgi:hypothetical protein
MKTATFKLVNEPAKPVQLFRGYSGEFEQGFVLFFALIVSTFIFSRLYRSAHNLIGEGSYPPFSSRQYE